MKSVRIKKSIEWNMCKWKKVYEWNRVYEWNVCKWKKSIRMKLSVLEIEWEKVYEWKKSIRIKFIRIKSILMKIQTNKNMPIENRIINSTYLWCKKMVVKFWFNNMIQASIQTQSAKRW